LALIAVRLGGMVEAGSLKTDPDGVTIRFVVGDGKARIPVMFKGIVPDLFKENSGVVAEGKRAADGTFVADNLLAKHDEKYVPREMKDMTEAQARQTLEKTK
jgi:cytochrome c-type biogenesis protein CcmE